MLVGTPYDLLSNVADEVKMRNIKINNQRQIERFGTKPQHDGKVAIIGGGPSLANTLEEIKIRKLNGCQIWATNNTYRYLLDNGIQSDAHVFLDSRPENIEFLHPDPDVTYYLNQACDPSLFDYLEGHKIVMYDLSSAATGFTVGIKAIYLAGFSGFRKFYLYGFDSSYKVTISDSHIPKYELLNPVSLIHHSYPQKLNDLENVIDVTAEGRSFKCAPWMAIQAEEFQQVACSFIEQGCELTVAGEGLIPWLANRMLYQPKILTCVWDLQVCPATYDFGTFLNESERKRIEIGAEAIDLVIQPGPLNGFRNDELPQNHGSREGMLYRVVVAMARLLPSVRNIEVLKKRKFIEADHVFPDGYTAINPIPHYGHYFAQYATPILKSTSAAQLHIGKAFPKAYVTITLREASHWETRNSNIKEWRKVEEWLLAEGYQVVWVPDAESKNANLYSFDLDMRLALYEKSVINLGINNGPMMILPFTSARYLIFKLVTEGIPWTEKSFHDKWGTKEGDQPGGMGRFIFAKDDYETIINEFKSILQIREAA